MRQLIIVFLLLILMPLTIYAEETSVDKRKFYLHANDDELASFNWGNFLSCLRTVQFPNDKGPRVVNKNISRLVTTTINDKLWVFSVREDDTQVTLESITINTHKYYSLNDKRHLFLRIVANCQIEE